MMKELRKENAMKLYNDGLIDVSVLGQLDIHNYSDRIINTAVERGWITVDVAEQIVAEQEVKKMFKTNVEIARMVETRGYDFVEALESIDAGRTAEEELLEITEKELNEMVDNICSSFDCETEEV